LIIIKESTFIKSQEVQGKVLNNIWDVRNARPETVVLVCVPLKSNGLVHGSFLTQTPTGEP